MMPWTCYSIIYADVDYIYVLFIGIRYILFFSFCFLRHSLKAQVVSAILSLSQNFARFLLFLSSVFLQGQVHLSEPVTSWFCRLPHFWFTGKFELLSSACDVPQVCWALRWHGNSYLFLTAWCWAVSSALLLPTSRLKLFWGPLH